MCIEDIFHKIVTVSPNFMKVNKFLCPFKLKTPFDGLRKKHNHYIEGGDGGNHENS